ncbi:MAG: helix-turn-helix transcriptional regulator [Clostridia bacterium]|nr:helix-turn-helix transcriptional regulator [Clostridia bacterium]
MKGYPKLKALLVERGIKQKEIADVLEITLSTFNNKLNGVSDFDLGEVRKLCNYLSITSEIFLL